MPSAESSTSATQTPAGSTRRHPLLPASFSLRRPPTVRKASNPKLSVIFADPSLSHGATPSRPGTLASEDALARQMNAGGQDMGLRSRRSSSATIRTMRNGSGVTSPGIEEEVNEAGPSTPREKVEEGNMVLMGSSAPDPGVGSTGQGSVGEGMAARRLNPKQSSSWLRWNAPSGFPRSRAPSVAGSMVDKEKGKARDDEARDAAVGVSSSFDEASAPTMDTSGPFGPSAPIAPVVESPTDLIPPDPPSAQPPEPFIPAATISRRTNRRNWWSRTASPAPSIRNGQAGEAKAASLEVTAENGGEAPSDPVPPPAPSLPTADDVSTPLLSSDPTSVSVPPPAVPVPPSPARLADSQTASIPALLPVPGGWRSYIWGNPSAPPLPPGDSTSDDNTVPLIREPSVPVPPVPTSDAHDLPHTIAGADTDSAARAEVAMPPAPPAGVTAAGSAPSSTDNPSPPTAPGSGWGTFLFSLVAPQIAVSRSLDSASPSHPGTYPSDPSAVPSATEISVSPTEDQRPEPTSSSPSAPPNPSIPGLPNPSPLSTHSDTLSTPDLVPSSEAMARKASSSSTTGWLTYLAYRSTQKRVTDGSVRSGQTGAGRNSSELGEEEVMDLSADPEFPAAELSSGQAGAGIGATKTGAGDKDKDKMPPPKTIPNKASSAALTVRGKRLSNSSIRPTGTLTPLSSSPKTAGPGIPDPKGAPTSSHRPASVKSSALPTPSSIPAQQPNLVIPIFTTTFDRPPRSLLPLQPPAQEGPAAGTTSALAWRALSVAGSYVYAGDKSKGKEKAVEVEDESKKETRGLKEGRSVGGDLPRRTGLGGGDADEGWRNVRRVVVVGVHGWFPAKMLNSVIGEPTGTSQKFANMMGAAVKQFFAEQGIEDEIRLTLMPLEGEGTIDSRVDRLYKAYLSNPAWINDLRRADAIFFAAHSQGCIVTTHLLSRMIAQGHIRTPLNADAVGRCEWAFGPVGLVPPESARRRSPLAPLSSSSSKTGPPGSEGGFQKVCMLAMCGVHLGPLYSISTSNVIQPYLQWFENAAARELFEFQESTSGVSGAYQKALGMVLENGVKVVLLASLNDQVVPIYGASFSTATHPLLLRALFVDGASYSQTDFMTNLLAFAFMLRNAGLDDQRLIEHLSEATAGSLTGVGHSSPYEEPQCYALAVKYLFLSGPSLTTHPTSPATSPPSPTSPTSSPLQALRIEPFSARDTRNEYELPWIMRALVDSPEVKDLFPGELKELKEGVGAWRPVTKVLKEVKKRADLEASGWRAGQREGNNADSIARTNGGTTVEVETNPELAVVGVAEYARKCWKYGERSCIGDWLKA